MTLAEINRRIAKFAPHVELIRGEGYHYFVFDDGTRYETETVYVPYTNSFSSLRWIEDAKEFANRVEASFAA